MYQKLTINGVEMLVLTAELPYIIIWCLPSIKITKGPTPRWFPPQKLCIRSITPDNAIIEQTYN